MHAGTETNLGTANSCLSYYCLLTCFCLFFCQALIVEFAKVKRVRYNSIDDDLLTEVSEKVRLN